MAQWGGASLAALLLLLLPATVLGQAPPAVTVIYSCSELSDALYEISTFMEDRRSGKSRFTIELQCDATADFSDCPASALNADWTESSYGPRAPLLDLTIRGAGGCTGARRPVLSSNATVDGTGNDGEDGPASPGDALISLETTTLQVTLQNLVLDGREMRAGVSALESRGLSLINVDIVNAVAGPNGEGAAVWAEGTPVRIFGGRFAGNDAGAGGLLETAGGAIYFSHIEEQQGGIIIKGATFTNNSADRGGAVAFYKSTPRAVKLTCTLCAFDRNRAVVGSAIHMERDDEAVVNGRSSPGAAPTVVLGASTFTGNANPATALCGIGSAKFKSSKLKFKDNQNLGKSAATRPPACTDFSVPEESGVSPAPAPPAAWARSALLRPRHVRISKRQQRAAAAGGGAR